MVDGRHRGARRADAKSPLTVEEQSEALLKDGPKLPARSCEPMPVPLPPWFDAELYRRGQRHFATNFFTMFVSKLAGLFSLLAVPSVLRVLMRSGRSSTAMTAFRRYLSTVSHMLEWYSANADGDLTDPTSKTYRSLSEVRGRHCAAARSVGHISQLDMALTQFAFIGFSLLSPEKLGIVQGDEEGLVHFWRVIGYFMGMEDRFNICRAEGVEETRRICSSLRDQVFVPNLKKPPDGFAHMSRAMLDGIWAITPVIDYHAFTTFIYNELAGVPYNEKISDQSRRAYEIQVYTQQQLLTSPWFAWFLRPILNFLMWFALFVTQRSQFFANFTLTDNVTTVQQNAYLAS